jgi:hypothetical protein
MVSIGAARKGPLAMRPRSAVAAPDRRFDDKRRRVCSCRDPTGGRRRSEQHYGPAAVWSER